MVFFYVTNVLDHKTFKQVFTWKRENLNSTFSAPYIKMKITFDVLDRLQENKVFQTAQTMNNILRSNKNDNFITTETVTFWIKGCLYGGEPALLEGLALFGEILLLWSSLL